MSADEELITELQGDIFRIERAIIAGTESETQRKELIQLRRALAAEKARREVRPSHPSFMQVTGLDVTPAMRADENLMGIANVTGIGSEFVVRVFVGSQPVQFVVYETPNGGPYEGLMRWSQSTVKGMMFSGDNYPDVMEAAYRYAVDQAVKAVRQESSLGGG